MNIFVDLFVCIIGQKEVKEDSNDDDPIRQCNGSQGLCKEECGEECCNSKCAAKYKDGVGTCKLYAKGYNFCICKYACQPN